MKNTKILLSLICALVCALSVLLLSPAVQAEQEAQAEEEQEEVEADYLTIIAEEDMTRVFFETANRGELCPDLWYSKNDGEWQKIEDWESPPTIRLNVNDSVRFRGENETFSNEERWIVIDGSGKYRVQGDVTTLLSPKGNVKLLKGKDFCFANLFYDNQALTSCRGLILPSETLSEYCYSAMFANCLLLRDAPELPSTQIAYGCYCEMFRSCSSLESAPALPATELDEYCYSHMFYGCSSLKEAPELPADNTVRRCYRYMFFGCTSLDSAPVLKSADVADGAYDYMFYSCRSMRLLEVGLTSWGDGLSTIGWVCGVPSGCVFICPDELDIDFSDEDLDPDTLAVGRLPVGAIVNPECAVTVKRSDHVRVNADKYGAAEGEEISFKVYPQKGYFFSIEVLDENGEMIFDALGKSESSYSFKAPHGKVTITLSESYKSAVALFFPDNLSLLCDKEYCAAGDDVLLEVDCAQGVFYYITVRDEKMNLILEKRGGKADSFSFAMPSSDVAVCAQTFSEDEINGDIELWGEIIKDCLPSEEEPILPDDDTEDDEDEDKIDWGNILLVAIGALIGCAVGIGAVELICLGKNKKKSKQNETAQTEKEEDNKS